MNEKRLNQGQQAAADGFFEFLMGPEKEFIISGPGGVGKTFLMGYLIDKVMPRYETMCQMMGLPVKYHEVAMTATTNKAAEVLGQATGRPTQTIHSFLKILVYNDYDTGKTTLKRRRDWEVHCNKVIFIDECSMIDSELLKFIDEGTYDCKIVYVGDHCQLAPVKEVISPVFKKDLPFFELSEQMRNNGQEALMAVCQQLRDTVETGIFQPISIVPGVIDHFDSPDDDLAMQAELERYFAESTQQHRILAYRNDRVMDYNYHIRQMRQLPPLFTEGEYLVNNTSVNTGLNKRLSVEEEVKVMEIADKTEFVPLEPEVSLEVLPATVLGTHGLHKVKIPVNRDHLKALIRHYGRAKNWPKYWRLKENYPDLRPRDAATVHKSQGSTYDTVFIDLDDLSTCTRPDVAARLLYVAFSRAKERIVLYGDLAPKYGGLRR